MIYFSSSSHHPNPNEFFSPAPQESIMRCISGGAVSSKSKRYPLILLCSGVPCFIVTSLERGIPVNVKQNGKESGRGAALGIAWYLFRK